MSTTTAITALDSTTAGGRRTGGTTAGRDLMAQVADTLGMSSADLRSQRASGKSLNEIADAQGVSHDDLITAIKQGLPADAGDGTQSSDDIAEKIAETAGMPARPQGAPQGGPHGGPHGAPPAGGPKGTNSGLTDDDKLTQISKLLDMDTEDVTDQATTASSLISMLQSKGVDLTALRDVLDKRGDLIDVAA